MLLSPCTSSQFEDTVACVDCPSCQRGYYISKDCNGLNASSRVCSPCKSCAAGQYRHGCLEGLNFLFLFFDVPVPAMEWPKRLIGMWWQVPHSRTMWSARPVATALQGPSSKSPVMGLDSPRKTGPAQNACLGALLDSSYPSPAVAPPWESQTCSAATALASVLLGTT
jgi:hypothetical protein